MIETLVNVLVKVSSGLTSIEFFETQIFDLKIDGFNVKRNVYI